MSVPKSMRALVGNEGGCLGMHVSLEHERRVQNYTAQLIVPFFRQLFSFFGGLEAATALEDAIVCSTADSSQHLYVFDKADNIFYIATKFTAMYSFILVGEYRTMYCFSYKDRSTDVNNTTARYVS